ncbi:MAG: glycoside hydrolase family 3 N-terminal domain-containing protein [Pseudomonadota bacterium]
MFSSDHAVKLRNLILGCAGPRLLRQERQFFSQIQPFGFILFSRNIDTPNQLSDLVADLRAAVGWHAPVFIDQEGGRVQRMAPPHWPQLPPPLTHVGHPKSDRLFWLRGRLLAHDLAQVGIDVNCTPTVDVACAETHPFLQNRCYGWDAPTVTRHDHAIVDGHAAGGVASVIKHMPGHGRATLDSHLDLPKVSARMADLQDDFAPFRALNSLSMGMTAHLVYTDIDDTAPATQSAPMIRLIRDDIGFKGLLMTDDISMQALYGDVTHRAQRACAAGCDVILHCNGDMGEMQALADATDGFEGQGADRAIHALNSRPQSTVNLDIDALWAEFNALIAESP